MLGRSLIYRSAECAKFAVFRMGSGGGAMKASLAVGQPSRGVRSIAEQTFQQLVRREQVPTYALIIGSCALCFQVAVLFPWHEKLSEEFEALEKVTAEIKRNAAEVDERMNALVALEKSVLRKEQSILQREEAIMRFQYEILSTAKQIVHDLDENGEPTSNKTDSESPSNLVSASVSSSGANSN